MGMDRAQGTTRSVWPIMFWRPDVLVHTLVTHRACRASSGLESDSVKEWRGSRGKAQGKGSGGRITSCVLPGFVWCLSVYSRSQQHRGGGLVRSVSRGLAVAVSARPRD